MKVLCIDTGDWGAVSDNPVTFKLVVGEAYTVCDILPKGFLTMYGPLPMDYYMLAEAGPIDVYASSLFIPYYEDEEEAIKEETEVAYA